MSELEMWEPGQRSFPTDRLDEFLLWAADRGATDIAFSTGLPVFIEVDGQMRRATRSRLDGPAMGRVAGGLHVSRERAETELRGGGPIDCSHTAVGPERRRRRFRVNMLPKQFDGRWGMGVALRVLPEDVPELDELAVEDEIAEAMQLGEGICLVTGVPGSGKSTLLAAAMRRLVEKGRGRVLTLENPIEFDLSRVESDLAMIEQTEIPGQVTTFSEALRAAVRRRPAAVMVGEARDLETIEAVLNASDQGMAVYSTTHTVGVSATMRRLLSAFPLAERDERAVALLQRLTLVATQMLVPNPKGGRTAIREWLRFDSELKSRLFDLPREDWPTAIQAEVRKRCGGLGEAGVKAHEAGRIGREDLARALAASGDLRDAGERAGA